MRNKNLIKADTLCSIGEVALTLNMTIRRIRQLQALGVLPRSATRGKYNLVECCRAYTTRQRRRINSLQATRGRRRKATVKIPTYSLQQAIQQSLQEFLEAARAMKKREVIKNDRS
jgi:DNA-binding transcriptional MerR regulator